MLQSVAAGHPALIRINFSRSDRQHMSNDKSLKSDLS